MTQPIIVAQVRPRFLVPLDLDWRDEQNLPEMSVDETKAWCTRHSLTHLSQFRLVERTDVEIWRNQVDPAVEGEGAL